MNDTQIVELLEEIKQEQHTSPFKEDDEIIIDIKNKELLFAYSDNSKNFKVIPFSKMDENYLKNYKEIEEEYMNIVSKEL